MAKQLDDIKHKMISIIDDMEEIIDTIGKFREKKRRGYRKINSKKLNTMECSVLYEYFEKQIKHVSNTKNKTR